MDSQQRALRLPICEGTTFNEPCRSALVLGGARSVVIYLAGKAIFSGLNVTESLQGCLSFHN
jgi:hypothetical protein